MLISSNFGHSFDCETLLISTEINKDDRGEFSRIYDLKTIQTKLPNFELKQVSFSKSLKSNTRRGLHVQINPSIEIKIVRVLEGQLVDVIIDMRKNSDTFAKWAMYSLNDFDGNSLIVPAGFAHGIQTLSDNTIVAYGMNTEFDPTRDAAIQSDDPFLDIPWPCQPAVISRKDKNADLVKDFISKLI